MVCSKSQDTFVLFQDVDGAYASKVELEVKLETLRQDLDFFRCYYETVRKFDAAIILSVLNKNIREGEGSKRDFHCFFPCLHPM